MQGPLWTDVWQTIAAIISIPAAIIGFLILFKRDKNKEAQIQNLSQIVVYLKSLVEDTEKRYRISKTPYIKITGAYLDEGNIGLKFVNSNPNTSIFDYQSTSENENYFGFTHQVQDSDGKQFFYLNIPIESAPLAYKVTMNYQTTENFIFEQNISVMIGEDYNVTLHKSPIYLIS